MVALSHKAKQYGWFALKVFILVVAFVYIFNRIGNQNKESWGLIFDAISKKNIGYILLFLAMATTNWFFEIKKWQTVVQKVKKISFFEATKQSLAALTVSLATPNRIGDYGAKIMYFEKSYRKKIALLNFVSNGFQLIATLIFGLIGLILIFPKLNLEVSGLKLILGSALFIFIGSLAYFFRKRAWFIKGFTLENSWNYFRGISFFLKLKVFIFSVIRYLIFSGLFFLLLQYFGATTSFLETIPYITTMYLFVSVVPMFFIFDVVIRGSISIWLLSIININDMVILTTVFMMWILNFIIPAILGGVYVIKFRRN